VSSSSGRSRTITRAPTKLQCSLSTSSNLPEQYKEGPYKLQFVVFSRLVPDKATSELQSRLPEHEKWLKSLDKQGKLTLHGNFLNAGMLVTDACVKVMPATDVRGGRLATFLHACRESSAKADQA
jgi:hypothetical protein